MVDANGIALVVNEPAPGRFYWVLQKQDVDDGSAVDTASAPLPSYGLAMMAGMFALQRRRGFFSRRPARESYESRTDFGPTTIQ